MSHEIHASRDAAEKRGVLPRCKTRAAVRRYFGVSLSLSPAEASALRTAQLSMAPSGPWSIYSQEDWIYLSRKAGPPAMFALQLREVENTVEIADAWFNRGGEACMSITQGADRELLVEVLQFAIGSVPTSQIS